MVHRISSSFSAFFSPQWHSKVSFCLLHSTSPFPSPQNVPVHTLPLSFLPQQDTRHPRPTHGQQVWRTTQSKWETMAL
ncbi:hypothetical protein E2C01_017330 [Portunus trituberculatus]|uniref:Uncharacterized protein n=1 Tax=Portunus trituberculatus TaxID=210409 RepID=A0A5B7DRM0_PORTR|nr:hypothetical protein [Portunus trituberculatus]